MSLVDYDWADLIDQEDKVRMLIDPASQYAQAAAWAMGRAMDDAIIVNAIGVAYTGVDGSVQTNYDTGMTIPVTVKDPAATAGNYGMNVAKLLAAKEMLDSKDVDPEEERFCVLPARQITSLLNSTKTTSADYNTVKALVEGKIDTFVGFKFKPRSARPCPAPMTSASTTSRAASNLASARTIGPHQRASRQELRHAGVLLDDHRRDEDGRSQGRDHALQPDWWTRSVSERRDGAVT